MQYTIRNIPRDLDEALRARARMQGRSLNEVALEALRRDVGLAGSQPKRRDLSPFTGSWIEDPEVDRTLADQRSIDEHMWE